MSSQDHLDRLDARLDWTRQNARIALIYNTVDSAAQIYFSWAWKSVRYTKRQQDTARYTKFEPFI